MLETFFLIEKKRMALANTGKTLEPTVISNVGVLRSGPTSWVKPSDDCSRKTFWLKPEGKLWSREPSSKLLLDSWPRATVK